MRVVLGTMPLLVAPVPAIIAGLCNVVVLTRSRWRFSGNFRMVMMMLVNSGMFMAAYPDIQPVTGCILGSMMSFAFFFTGPKMPVEKARRCRRRRKNYIDVDVVDAEVIDVEVIDSTETALERK